MTITITLLSQPFCVYCDQAKEILSRLAPDYALEINEVGLQTVEGRSLAIINGVMFAPGILIDNKLFSFGRLSERKLKSTLDHVRTKELLSDQPQ